MVGPRTIEPVDVTLRDGAPVRLRPLAEDDGPRLVELFECLSPETVYNRFLSPVRHLDESRVRALTHLDPAVECGLAASLFLDGHERLLAVGRFKRVNDTEAEIAIVVGDPWHRLGVGRALLRRMTEVARGMGLMWFWSTIDPGNHRLLRFAEAAGFKGTLKYRDGLLVMRTEIAALFPEGGRDPVDGHPRP
jgi:GNAT superfamily N-acetyltransferase